MNVLEGPHVKGLNNETVPEVLGQEKVHALVAELHVIRPQDAFPFPGKGLDFHVVPGLEPLPGGILLYEVDEVCRQGLDLGHLLLLRPAAYRAQAHIVLENAVVRHGVEVFLGVFRHD